jgi:hypothetical protein
MVLCGKTDGLGACWDYSAHVLPKNPTLRVLGSSLSSHTGSLSCLGCRPRLHAYCRHHEVLDTRLPSVLRTLKYLPAWSTRQILAALKHVMELTGREQAI